MCYNFIPTKIEMGKLESELKLNASLYIILNLST